nr:alpha-glucosidase [Amphibacillus jilinensis]
MPAWWKNSVVYQIYPRSFKDSDGDGVGDINGITEKLSYLQDLGIDIIWLSPIYQSPNYDNGYDISDYYQVMNTFGTMDDFQHLLEQAEQYRIKIMMDLVVNHTSDQHQWFIKSRATKDNQYRDYYIWRDPKPDGSAPTNWGAAFGGSTWTYDQKTEQYYLHLFSDKQPDLNWENPDLRQDVYQMMIYWLEKGVAGFRMDVINMISKDPNYPDGERLPTGFGDGGPYYFNGPKIHDYLQEMHNHVLKNYDTITVGEMPNVTVEQAKRYTDIERDELDMVFHFDHVSLGDGRLGKWSPQPWKLTELKSIFTRWQKGLDQVGWNSLYWSNHDQPRAISRFGDDSEHYRVRSGKMLATCLHMLKGTPYIYQGEELGMTNAKFESINDYRDLETLNAYNDLVNRNLCSRAEIIEAIQQRSRDHARTPMQWSNAKNAGFTTGDPWIAVNPNYKTINAQVALHDHTSIFHYYKKLIQLRKQYQVIVEGSYDILLANHEQIYAFTRTLANQTLIVVCNFSKQNITFDLPRSFDLQRANILISNLSDDPLQKDNRLIFEPYQAIVYLIEN